MKRIILAIISFSFCIMFLHAEQMNIHLEDGTTESVEMSEIDNITFEQSGGGTVTDIDGNVYQTIVIGDQEWMMENLKVTHYSNGDQIQNITGNNPWINTYNTKEGAYCVYDNDSVNANTYGALYNWYAVDDNRGLAPDGWHIPSDDEWKELEMYIGMSQQEADREGPGFRGTNEGSKLAGNKKLWDDDVLENNSEFGSSGFVALPGGWRSYTYGKFFLIGRYAFFWSSSNWLNYDHAAWFRELSCSSLGVCRNYGPKWAGCSVRCIRD